MVCSRSFLFLEILGAVRSLAEQSKSGVLVGRVAPDQDLAEMEVLDDISGVPDVLGGCAGLF